MFHLAGIFFIAVFCVANAAVTIDVYEKEVDTCNPGTCDQLCRRMGFISGKCVGNTCECRLREQNESNDVLSAINENSIEEVEKEEVGECQFLICNHVCILMKFGGGACVDGQCRCFKQLEDQIASYTLKVEEDAAPTGLDQCYPLECDQLCRRLKFPGGVCVNGRCKCDNFRLDDEPQDIEKKENSRTLRACNPSTCYNMCRVLKYSGGWCRFGRCECF